MREGCGRQEKVVEGERRLWKVVEALRFEEEIRALRLKVSGLHTYSSKTNVMLSTPWWLPKATIKGVLLTQQLRWDQDVESGGA